MTHFLIVLALLIGSPTMALACGGFFCDAVQPVNQAAERILFAVDDDKVDMHVRITYSGPPSNFGWLLPVPRDVETKLSSEQLFTRLDSRFTPSFRLTTRVDPACDFLASDDYDGYAYAAGMSAPSDEAGGPPRVEVISREEVGPYDRTILAADNIAVLRDWLDENEYQIPAIIDETLQPYIDVGAVFVAIKLIPGRDTNDIVPLRLIFSGTQPTIPIVPTSVAADPDMGIIVHLLGASRAIPVNYLHVRINQGAIDWTSGGSNYADVVSQAADEANGKAFATDFAGPHGFNNFDALPTVPANFIADVEEIRGLDAPTRMGQAGGSGGDEAMDDGEADVGWRILQDILSSTDREVVREIAATITVPDGVDYTAQDVAQCPACYGAPDDYYFYGVERADEITVDGEALAARLREFNEIRGSINGLFRRHGYLTRLYSTMSPAEMTLDPSFSFNADLENVSNRYEATQHVPCKDGEPDFGNTFVETEDGLVIPLNVDGDNPAMIVRQDGATVRGEDVLAAAVIEQHMEAGQPEMVDDRRMRIQEEMNVDLPPSAGRVTPPQGGMSQPDRNEPMTNVSGGMSLNESDDISPEEDTDNPLPSTVDDLDSDTGGTSEQFDVGGGLGGARGDGASLSCACRVRTDGPNQGAWLWLAIIICLRYRVKRRF